MAATRPAADMGGSAAAAAHPSGPHVDRVGPEATDTSVPGRIAITPGCLRIRGRAAHPPVGHGLRGRLGGADNDHRDIGWT